MSSNETQSNIAELLEHSPAGNTTFQSPWDGAKAALGGNSKAMSSCGNKKKKSKKKKVIKHLIPKVSKRKVKILIKVKKET